MRNSPTLPGIALVCAVVLALLVWLSHGSSAEPLSEIELAGVAWAIGLAIYGIQGLLSVLLEGKELRPGRVLPRLTGSMSAMIVLFSLLLLGIAVLLGIGLSLGWATGSIGALAGGGCIVLAALLVFYKEAFIGDEATLDSRDDGIPW